MLPFQALNNYGRVLDFEEGSYWFSTSPKVSTLEKINTKLIMDESGFLIGKVKKSYNGYFSKYKKELIDGKSEADYLSYLESKTKNLEILSYANENFEDHEKQFIENFEIEIQTAESIGGIIYLNPFIEKYTKNPFQLKQRNYPVNFWFKINEIYTAQIDIPSDFIIKTIPEDINLILPNNGDLYIAKFQKEENKIIIYTKIKLNQTIYGTDDYQYLKELFNQVIKTQNSLITFEKKSNWKKSINKFENSKFESYIYFN